MNVKKAAKYCLENSMLITLMGLCLFCVYIGSNKLIYYDVDPAACFAGLTFVLLATSISIFCLHILISNYPFEKVSKQLTN